MGKSIKKCYEVEPRSTGGNFTPLLFETCEEKKTIIHTCIFKYVMFTQSSLNYSTFIYFSASLK